MKTMVIAPHPDDETLGLGGTLLRRLAEGYEIAWLIVTKVSVEEGWSTEVVQRRNSEIARVANLYNFKRIYQLNYATTRLDQYPMSGLVNDISEIFNDFLPEELFVPHRGDVHTDHQFTYDAAVSCTKWFRHPSIKRVLAYETLSETDFGLNVDQRFSPNIFIDVEKYIEQKINIMNIYASEIHEFPFPRSEEAIRSLAKVRGASSGFMAAEAFQLLRERQ